MQIILTHFPNEENQCYHQNNELTRALNTHL